MKFCPCWYCPKQRLKIIFRLDIFQNYIHILSIVSVSSTPSRIISRLGPIINSSLFSNVSFMISPLFWKYFFIQWRTNEWSCILVPITPTRICRLRTSALKRAYRNNNDDLRKINYNNFNIACRKLCRNFMQLFFDEFSELQYWKKRVKQGW